MPNVVKMATVTFVVVLSTSLVTGEPDWNQWRGPNRDGKSLETGLVDEFNESGPPLLWHAEGLGKGHSTVAITDGRIFTLGRRGDSEQLIALDIEGGSELWAADVGTGDHSNGTPTVDGTRVYAIGLEGDLICADTATGKVLWRKQLRKDFAGSMMATWGYSESPLIDGDLLVCTPGAKEAMIVALDKHTGHEIWKAVVPSYGDRGNDGAGYSSVVLSEGGGVRQYIQLTGRGVIGIRASDGEFLWGYDGIANKTANIPTPVVSGDHVFCSSGYDAGAALLKLSGRDGGVTAQEVYFLDPKNFQNHQGGMILVGDHIYAGAQTNQGFPICIELATGEVVWGGKIRGPGVGTAAITYADGKLVFRYQNGVVALIDATDRKYRLRGSFHPVYHKDNCWALPVISDARLYLREHDSLMCYDVRAN